MSLNAFLSNPKAKRLLGFPTKATPGPAERANEPQATPASPDAQEAPKGRAKAGKKGAQ